MRERKRKSKSAGKRTHRRPLCEVACNGGDETDDEDAAIALLLEKRRLVDLRHDRARAGGGGRRGSYQTRRRGRPVLQEYSEDEAFIDDAFASDARVPKKKILPVTVLRDDDDELSPPDQKKKWRSAPLRSRCAGGRRTQCSSGSWTSVSRPAWTRTICVVLEPPAFACKTYVEAESQRRISAVATRSSSSTRRAKCRQVLTGPARSGPPGRPRRREVWSCSSSTFSSSTCSSSSNVTTRVAKKKKKQLTPIRKRRFGREGEPTREKGKGDGSRGGRGSKC